MAELKGIEYLRHKLEHKRQRVLVRYKYYEMKNYTQDIGISSPDFLRHWMPVLGWCSKAVDSLADRLVFREFRDDNFDLQEIFNMNNPDTLFSSAILGALIGSCDFIYIADSPDGEYPRMQVIDGSDATGILDPITGLLTEGYCVLERDKDEQVIQEAYFYPYMVEIHEHRNRGYKVTQYPNKVPYPLLVPIINRPDSKRPFGHSRISRACMDIVGGAIRTLKRSEIAAEFYSFPQKYITGLSEEAEPLDRWKATMSSMLMFTKDDDGDRPTIGQFTQQSMTPQTDQLRMYASLFGGETGLTLDDLGFATENPSSAEAIKAAHESLRLTARKAQRTFGMGFINAGFLARCLMDDYAYNRNQVYLTKAIWEPVFEPDYAALGQIGDGALKINQAVAGYFDKETLRDLTGIEPSNEIVITDSTLTSTGIEEMFEEEIDE